MQNQNPQQNPPPNNLYTNSALGYQPPGQYNPYPQYYNYGAYGKNFAASMEGRKIDETLSTSTYKFYNVWLYIFFFFDLMYFSFGFSLPLYTVLIEASIWVVVGLLMLVAMSKRRSDLAGYAFIIGAMGIIPALFNGYIRFNYHDIYRGRDAAMSSIFTSAISLVHYALAFLVMPYKIRNLLEQRDAAESKSRR